MNDYRCESAAEMLQYLNLSKKLKHEVLLTANAKVRTLGFVDSALDMEFFVPFTTFTKAPEETRKRIDDWLNTGGGSMSLAVQSGLDVILQAIFDEDPESAKLSLDEVSTVWTSESVERVERSNVDETLAPHNGSIKREEFHYIQPLSPQLGQSEQATKMRAHADLEAYDAELRAKRGIVVNGVTLAMLTSKGMIKTASTVTSTHGVLGGQSVSWSAVLAVSEVIDLLKGFGNNATFEIRIDKNSCVVLDWQEFDRTSETVPYMTEAQFQALLKDMSTREAIAFVHGAVHPTQAAPSLGKVEDPKP